MGAEIWQGVIVGAVAPLIVYWLSNGLKDFIKARKARKAGLKEDEREAVRDHEAYLMQRAEFAERERDRYRRRILQLDDYVHALRRQLSDAGVIPLPWPRWEE